MNSEDKVKIALIGYGKMGQMIAEVTKNSSCTLASIIDKSWEGTSYKTVSEESLQNIDVVIDFSHATGILERIEYVTQLGIPMVIGTTGWDNDYAHAKEIVKRTRGSVIYASNFSAGMNYFFRIVQHAAKIFQSNFDYDIALFEHHHRQKQDHPSGTAQTLSRILLDTIEHKKKAITELSQEAIEKNELQIASLRVGSETGFHEVIFDGANDAIRISHSSRTRVDFAKGALLAASWIQGKEGWFTAEDLFV